MSSSAAAGTSSAYNAPGSGGPSAASTMAPSTNKNLEPEEILQAVLVADSFNKRYLPLTIDMPRCLLPLANIPMIEYSLEALAMAGVQQVFLVCCHQSDAIKTYIRNSRWHQSTTPVITIIVSQELLSMGDVLREMDAKQVLTSDFILISGDVVTNTDLKAIVNEHKARRTGRDKNCIMTMVLNEACPRHPTRSRGEEILMVLDDVTDECVHFESMAPHPQKKRIAMGVEVFEKHSQVVVRNDLIDCCIDICSIEVPALFTENFDYQDLRADFLKGILESELLGKTIYAHVLNGTYAARASNLQMYDAISKDIMSRWVYPITPDANITMLQPYEHSRRNVYRGTKVKLSRSAIVEEMVVLGEGAMIGDGSRIEGSVLGRGCIVQDNCIITGSYIFPGSQISSNCHIMNSIIADGVIILENTKLESGCVVGAGAVIGPNIIIPSMTKITATQKVTSLSDFGSEDEIDVSLAQDDLMDRLVKNRQLLGTGAQAYPYESSHYSEDEEEPDLLNVRLGRMGVSVCSLFSDCVDIEGDTDVMAGHSESEEEVDWEREVEESLARAFQESHTVDIAALELNTLKMAMNISFADLRSVVIPIILSRVDSATTAKDVQLLMTRWGPLIDKFVHSTSDQMDTVHIISKKCLLNAAVMLKHFPHIVKHFYDIDVLEEEALLKWFHSLSETKDTRVRDAITPFIRWLKEAEEESTDED